ncbi:hypothetical protein C8035_v002322 [Colletotrichum spinosum]|uniref:Uncharacterized protein n=1 Tax=Colletotrichum spinosum TaxID=1347390 RepID=A0A4R8Q240_9PEZI|nr:hypothetical protein C8035_v002322 [Colletotrichum spinosum]
MRPSMLFGLLAAACGVSQASLIDLAPRLPQCGLACIPQAIPSSACQVVTNDTCICNDADLKNTIQVCLLANCTRLETIDVARIQAEGCHLPVRERKVDILAPLAIQVVGVAVVPLRLYARWSTMHHFETDDWIMIVCGIMFIPFVVLGQLVGAVAFGEDIWMVKPEELTFGLKVFYVDESLYLCCLGLTKISVLFFYLRIFPNRAFRWATYATMGNIILSTTVLLFLQIFQCIPFEYNWLGWKGDFGPHHCLDINTLAFVAGGLSISHDVIILLLPLPLLYHLNMGFRKKAGIFLMFSLGVFILITSCVRLRYIVLFTRSLNPTWDFTDPLVWSGVEVSVSMIVVCLPAMRILLSRLVPQWFASTTASDNTPRNKASIGSSNVGEAGRSWDAHRRPPPPPPPPRQHDFEAEGRQLARTARLAEKRRHFFSFHRSSAAVEPNESQLELGDRSGGAVSTHIRYGNGVEPARASFDSGIHVRTTIVHDEPGTGSGRGKPKGAL